MLSVWCQMQALAPCAKLQGLGCGVCEVCVMGVTGDMRSAQTPAPCGLSSVYLCVHSPRAASCSGPVPGSGLPWGMFLGSAPHPAASHRVH